MLKTVSVPSFGDSFFIPEKIGGKGEIKMGFRPLIRGFFFYILELVPYAENSKAVSVPSFGDSFFIRRGL